MAMIERLPAPPRAAVFLDKDGTLVYDLPYNIDASRLKLRPDAGPALARLRAAGYALILVTNQPGVALGRFAESDLAPIWSRLMAELAAYQAALDGIYYCPHHPDGRDPRYGFLCDCRKPQPGLLHRAAADHDLALERCWFVGDILDDVEAGRRAGCRTVLLDVGSETEWRPGPWREPDVIADSLAAAARWIITHPAPCEPPPEAAAPCPSSQGARETWGSPAFPGAAAPWRA